MLLCLKKVIPTCILCTEGVKGICLEVSLAVVDSDICTNY